MGLVYRRDLKLRKWARMLEELDADQADLDRHDAYTAEDIRWARIFVSKAMASINTQIALDAAE